MDNQNGNGQQPYGSPPPQGHQPYGQQPPYPQQPYGPQLPIDPPGKKESTIGLVCGILSMVLSCGIITGLVLGIVAVINARKAKAFGYTGGTTTAGLILGIIGIIGSALSIIYVIFAFVMYGSLFSSGYFNYY